MCSKKELLSCRLLINTLTELPLTQTETNNCANIYRNFKFYRALKRKMYLKLDVVMLFCPLDIFLTGILSEAINFTRSLYLIQFKGWQVEPIY